MPELTDEQAHLSASRSALARMRTKVAGLEAHGGNAVSTEYLKSALWHRMQALEDDPEVPLFFGRLDYRDPAERFYIGRRHITDEIGDPMVVDWRASVSRAFYRATRRAPMGVELRRRFGFASGRLTAFEDERLAAGEEHASSAILEAEIERPRVGPMRDIVATIQPEQDDIVRSELTTSVCVQGAPGTGKTAVGLHRAAYLLYTHRDQLTRQGVLVIGPNDSFLRYIADVLPALGEIDARHLTVEALAAGVQVRAEEPGEVARLKGGVRMATVLERALWGQLRAPTEALVVPRGARRWRIPAYEVEELVAGLRQRGVRYGAGRVMLAQRLAHAILVKMELSGDSPDDRVQDAVARSRPVRAFVDTVWPKVDPVRLVWRLLADPRVLADAAAGVLTSDERSLLSWVSPSRAPGSARWTLADAVLVDEVGDLVERTGSVAHVVLDEAQDLSPMMLRAVGRRCSTGSMTVLGDLAQATTPWAISSWTQALAHLGKPEAHLEELTLGFRVPADVIEYAARLLPITAPGLVPPTSVRRASGDLVIEQSQDLTAALVAAVRKASEREGSVGLIVPDAMLDATAAALRAAAIRHAVMGDAHDIEARVDLVPARLAKGLEFDHVVLAEPSQIASAEHDEVTGLRRLYVCLTRAVTSLSIAHCEPLPEPLRGPVPARVG